MDNAPMHTKGPWAAELDEAFKIRGGDGGLIATCQMLAGRNGLGGRRSTKEVAANARLIAAAPDLLAALEDAATYLSNCSYVDRAKWLAVCAAVKTAITKAKGN